MAVVAISVLTRDFALSFVAFSGFTCVVTLLSSAEDSAAKGSFLVLFFVDSLEAGAIEGVVVVEAVSDFFEEPRAVVLAGVITGVLSTNFLPTFVAGVKTLGFLVGVSDVGTVGELDAVSSSFRFVPRLVCLGVVEVVVDASVATSGSSAVEKLKICYKMGETK